MATRAAQPSRQVECCPYAAPPVSNRLQLESHQWLHEDGQRLTSAWFERAWGERMNEQSPFEGFIFGWMAVNTWAACVTGEDLDREYMRCLKEDEGLRGRFQLVMQQDADVRCVAQEFVSLLPIFKAQKLRRAGVYVQEGLARRALVQHYLDAGIQEFEPECAEWHRARGEPVPCDWPHVIAAIYRVRCNLFHGEKSAHSEMDRRIVRSAFLTLTGFFRAANIL